MFGTDLSWAYENSVTSFRERASCVLNSSDGTVVAFCSFKMLSAWCVVLISLERFISVWFPTKAKLVITKKRLLFSVIFLLLFFTIYNGYWTSFADGIIKG